MSALSILIRIAAGLALGIFFYGGLWLGVQRIPESRHPVLLTVGSFWIRTIVTLAGFYFLIDNHWQYAMEAIAGFTAGRFAVLRLKPLREAKPKCT